jgi:hypothetical protein
MEAKTLTKAKKVWKNIVHPYSKTLFIEII